MATGGNAIRGTRVGSGPMGEQDHGYHADRIAVSYWDGLGNETVRYFAAGLPDEEIPETIDHPQSGLPAGRDKANPPELAPEAGDGARLKNALDEYRKDVAKGSQEVQREIVFEVGD